MFRSHSPRFMLRNAAPVFILALLPSLLCASELDTEPSWRGLVVADELTCRSYDRKRDYLNIEEAVIARQGMASLYTGKTFDGPRDSEVDHIVALREAHDSGLCEADRALRHQFAHDLGNLTLASPRVNRQKGARDAAAWLPEVNQCWFAETVIRIKLKYGLTVDRQEVRALAAALATCKGDGP